MPDRILRQGWRSSRKLALTSAEGERMLIRLETIADDFGRFDADPVLVRAACFPRNPEYTIQDIVRWLGELETRELVLFYSIGADRYGAILKFGQRIRADKSKFPAPPAALLADIRARMPADARLDVVVVVVEEDVDKRATALSPQAPLPLIQAVPDLPAAASSGRPSSPESGETASFNRFCEAYPKKSRRSLAFLAWQRLQPSPELALRIIRATEYLARKETWGGDNVRYLPKPADFLEDRGYEAAWQDRPPAFSLGGRAECFQCRRYLPAWQRGQPGRCTACLLACGAISDPAAAKGAGS